jgi:MFS family permease
VADEPALAIRRNRRARAGASGAFAVQGLCFAAVLAQVPALRDKFHLDEGQLTIILAVVPIIAGVGSIVAGALSPRTGSRILLRLGGLGVCAAMAGIGLAPTLIQLFVAVGFFGFFLGGVDATMNMQGVAIQRRYGRSILASCHAWWSVAGITGAVAAFGAADRLSLWQFLGVMAAVGALVSLTAGPNLLRRVEEVETAPAVRAAGAEEQAMLRKVGRIVFVVGLAVMIMFIGDSATTSWSAIFLRDALAASGRIVPLGLAAYLTCQLLGRTLADRVIGRIGAMATLIGGSLIAAGGFALVALSQQPATAIGGFALVGVGLSVVVPLSFSAADALDPTGTGVVVARVNLFNYAGVVVGAALIGVLADAANLRFAFAVPGALVLGIIAVAPAFRVVDAARERAARSLAAR